MLIHNLIFLIFIISSEASADFVTGTCPKLQTPPNAIHIKPGFDYIDFLIENHEFFRVYAYLPSSQEYKRISLFSFDFDDGLGHLVSNLEITLNHYLNKNPQLAVEFYDNPEDLSTYGFVFTKGTVLYRDLNDEGLGCTEEWYKMPDYHYEIKFKRREYILIWGCAQMNESTYDRGLILASRVKRFNSSVLFESMLNDTGLRSESHIAESTLFRMTPKLNQSVNATGRMFFSDCMTKNRTKIPKLKESQDNIKILAFLTGIFVLILIFGIFAICSKFTSK